MDAVAHSTVNAIVEFTGWSHVCFAVSNEAETHWVVRAAGGQLKADTGTTCPIDHGVIGRVFRTKQAQLVRDIRVDPDYTGETPGLLSELAVPIMQGERVLAVLNLENDEPDTFATEEQELAESMAEAIALGMENARLFETAQMELAKRQQAQAQISASLEEKVILLKEIHHRVKNNLQVISSLLDLQANHINDQHVLEMFKESQGRVKSMALIHEQLYQSSDLSNINFAQYLNSLVNQVRRSYNTKAQAIIINLNVATMPLTIETAIPCGLIVNELVSNAFKYAFPNRRDHPGEISIDLQKTADNQVALHVRDNGVGIPEDIDLRRTKSLGLRLVNTLVKQLRGKVSIERAGGTKFEIIFGL
jgi:two-component sensor histidine kinase/putative methionine-R-sulfoxide reductase with GAF domain